jgi:protein-tyrosine phosphatase
MIDIHSHILPGVDDGARDFQQALDMLRMAINNGVKTQVLTPHLHPGRYGNTPENLLMNFLEFRHKVAEHELPLNLLLSAEVRIGMDVLDYLSRDDFPWLGEWKGNKVFLLEFPHNTIPANSLNMVSWLIKKRRLPMIVHPERNHAIQENPDLLAPYIEAGCLIQITSGSLISAFGKRAMQVAFDLLKKGVVTAIASDCHNVAYRPPNLALGLETAVKLIGERSANSMVTTIPGVILSRNCIEPLGSTSREYSIYRDIAYQ